MDIEQKTLLHLVLLLITNPMILPNQQIIMTTL